MSTALPTFRLVEPDTVGEANAACDGHPGSRFVAGGTDLLVNMRRGIGSPELLIDLSGIDELSEIQVTDNGVTIGAGVTIAALARNGYMLGGDGEIATGDELAAGGARHRLDFGDHRHGVMDDRLYEIGALRHELHEIGLAAIGVLAMLGDFLEIVAGAEGRPFRRDHDDARRRIAARLIERAGQRRHHRVAEAVPRLGVIERQTQDARLAFRKENLFHSPSSERSLSFSA